MKTLTINKKLILLLACLSMPTLHGQQLDRLADNQSKSAAITSIPEVSYYHIESCEKGACNMVKKTFRPSANNPIRNPFADTSDKKPTPIKVGTPPPLAPIIITQPGGTPTHGSIPNKKPTPVRSIKVEPLGPIVINEPGGMLTHGNPNSSFK